MLTKNSKLLSLAPPSASSPELNSSISSVRDTTTAAATKLLGALWRSPRQVHQIGSLDRQSGTFKNKPVKGVDQAIQAAQALSEAGKDAYFACSEFTTPDSRTAANVACAHAFWLDIDCGDEKAASGGGYATEADALEAVQIFCQKASIPAPTHIVSSGCGLHVYWALDQAADRATWQDYAGKLKALTKTLAFLADDSRTSDIASVLRMPGTLNHKYQPPRPVTLLRAAEHRVSKAAMLDAIDAAHNELCDVPSERQGRSCRNAAIPGADDAADGSKGEKPTLPTSPFLRTPVEPADVTLRLLEVLLKYLDPDSEYCDWLRVGMALHFETRGSSEGFRLFDRWSSAGKSYEGIGDTRAKWRSFQATRATYVTRRTLFWMAESEGISRERICAEAEPFQKLGGQNGAN